MIKGTSWLCLMAAFSILIYVSKAEDDDNNIPLPKLSQNIGAPTLKFLYCYSCGYKKAFDEYVNIVQQKYPYILIDGQNYDPPGMFMFSARLIGVVKMLIIICILLEVNIFMGPVPLWWRWCTENKLYASLIFFFLCNIVEVQLMQTGAFEISLNDVPLWSKLETGRIPQPAELFQIIDNHMQFSDRTIELKSGFAK